MARPTFRPVISRTSRSVRAASLLALSLVLVATARDAAGAQLQSLQSGTVTLSSGLPLVVLLPTPVDMTRAFVVFGASEDIPDPVDGQVSGQLTAPTGLTFQRVGGTGSVTIKYYVAEFSSGVSVQRGSTDVTIGTSFDVALGGAVDLTKSFPLISYRTEGVNFNCNDFVRAKITTSTNLQLSTDSALCGTAISIVEWQVVEYLDANVQSGDVTLTAGALSQTATLAPAVNTARSWLIYSYSGTPDATPDVGQYLVRGLLTDSTTLTFDRNNAVTVGIDLTWYLVEFTDGTTVQQGSEPFTTAETQRDVTLGTAVNPLGSIAAAGGDYQRGGRSNYAANDVAGVGWFTLDLTSSTNLRITRGATGAGTATADVGWFVVSFPLPTAVKLEAFSAKGGDASVVLDWRTGSELDNLGFYLYRGEAQSGPWTRLNASLIPGLGSSALGRSYSYSDTGLRNGTRYYYRLEDVDASSQTTSHGPVSAVPVAGASGSAPAGGEPPASRPSAKNKAGSHPACPDWVVAAHGSWADSAASSATLGCTRHGDPEAVSLAVVSRDARSATLELKTGGFYALREASGRVRVFVPGFDFPQDPQAPALPFRRAFVDAIVGRRVQLGGVRALEQVSFSGLVPTPLGKAEMQVSRDGTIRTSRRALPGTSPSHVSTALARLLPSVFQGETKSAVVQLQPLRLDARRQRILLSRRLLVRLLFTGRETGERGRDNCGRREGPQKPVSGELLARLYTTGRGLYAVTFDQLFPGRSRSLASSRLRLERQGEAVGYHLEPAGGLFGPGSVLYFHADATASSADFSSETAWELRHARNGVAMPIVPAAPGGDVIASHSTGLAAFEIDRFYQPGLLEAQELWLWEALASGATGALSFSLAGVDAASSRAALLEVFLQGASESGNAIDHHVRMSVNGTLAGEAQFAGKKPHRTSLSVPVSLLHEGANQLELTNVADAGASSFVFLDRFTVSYPQTSSLVSGRFEGTWNEGGTTTLSGASGPVALLDVTAWSAPGAASTPPPGSSGASWLIGYDLAGGALRFRAEAGHRYLAVSQQALLTPRVAAPAPSTLRSRQNQADYLLIAPRAFLTAAEPLLQRRNDQGLQTRAVAFEEITDEFGHGQPSAEAIQSFVAYAYQSWARPSPRYVLLLGDASYDPRNFMASSQPSPLPALFTRTSYLWTVSDPLLAAVNGEDALPDLAIGRLPASTVAQAEALVTKLIAWEDSGQGLSGPAALVADNPDLGGDFEADVRDIAQGFLAGKDPQLLLLRELGAGARPAIQAALDSGLSYLSYVGHGGTAVWASENVWNSLDAASLQAQSRQPLLLTLNCLNGYFVAPAFDSLTESLLKAEGRGAIAGLSPSGLSLDGPAHQYHRALMAELTSGRHERLGDAVAAAQTAYARSGLMPELLTVYHLLGDPATQIR